jgi:predicted nucleic acid-binding protein
MAISRAKNYYAGRVHDPCRYSIIVAWLDKAHQLHRESWRAILECAGRDQLAVSSVTYAELAAGGRTREAVDTDLKMFVRLELDFTAAWRAGQTF